MEVIKGLLVCFLMMTIIKFIHFKYLRKNKSNEKFDILIWIQDNWMDYFIYIGISFLVYVYNTDAINTINYVLQKIGTDWRIPDIENRSFYFVLGPIVLSFIAYKFLRNKVSKPVQNKITPLS
ncbi:hypothetical protein [Aquimarina sp. AU119]|uniref:hypothetical protein n=1 Tax=Aquimarina sp. AU119 TaxID=2108528 RepID=UPI000D6906D1|nr:hypothetical protein [Aquimarina sp. AU119]